MFGFVQWDNPLLLLLEVGLSILVIVVIMWLARRANQASVPDAYKSNGDPANRSNMAGGSAALEDSHSNNDHRGVTE